MDKSKFVNGMIIISVLLILAAIIGVLIFRQPRTPTGASLEETIVLARQNAFWAGFNDDPETPATSGPDYFLGGAFKVYLQGTEIDERKAAFEALLMAFLPFVTREDQTALQKAVATGTPGERKEILATMLTKQMGAALLLLVVAADEKRMAQALAGQRVDPLPAPR